MNAESTQPQLAAEIDTILRRWARAQSPEQPFADFQVGVITRPMQHKEGHFFAPGELVLFRPAAVVAAEGARISRPASVWSFELKKEVLVPALFLTPEAPVAHLEAENAEADDALNPAA